MKANELRIGNYFEDGEGRLCSVDVISRDSEDTRITAIHGALTTFPIKPIPLTEEWLLKFGFETKDKVFWDAGNFRVGQDRWGGYDYVNRRVDIDLKYVHQLQNLYFCLTGIELTIKE